MDECELVKSTNNVGNEIRYSEYLRILKESDISNLTIIFGTCKDCKHWKDSDGVYRRGIGAESKCPINNSRVFDGTFYCADFEKRDNENKGVD